MKILGSDFDGTFSYGGINDDKLSAVKKWREAGNKIGLVTGQGRRFYDQLSTKFPDLKFDFLAVCSGGYIIDGNGALIYEARCTGVPLKELFADLFSWGCKAVHVHSKKYACIVEKMENKPSWVAEEDVCFLENSYTLDSFNQASVLMPTLEESSAVVAKIREKYYEWLNPLQNGRAIDIVPAGVDKAQGMYRVMEFFDCAYEDVITVGDHINDINMIREFRSYAMENGVGKLKKLADGVVSDITEILEKEL